MTPSNAQRDAVSAPSPLILVTGATGYVGGRLVHRLMERGFRVRCMVRQPSRFTNRGTDHVDVVQGDVMEPASLQAALHGVDTAYYLVHALASAHPHREVEQVERRGVRGADDEQPVLQTVVEHGEAFDPVHHRAHRVEHDHGRRVVLGQVVRDHRLDELRLAAA